MKALGFPKFRVSTPSYEFLLRPRTAQYVTYKKLTDILEGKNIPIKSKNSSRVRQKSEKKSKREKRYTTSKDKKQSNQLSNINITFKGNQENNQIDFFVNYFKNEEKNIKNTLKFSSSAKEFKYERERDKEKGFIPYALQSHSYSEKTIKRINNHSIKKSEPELKDKPIIEAHDQMIDSWENRLQSDHTHLSYLFPKSWKF